MRLERGEKQGKWEGEAPAEPKLQRIATGDWRMTFLEGSAPALPKEFRRIRSSLEGRATARPKIFGASRDAPSSNGVLGLLHRD